MLPEETDIHLRLTMLGQYDDVAVMDGEPPKIPGNPQTLKYVVAHRGGTNLDSLFTAVIEPYKDARYIESIQEVAVMTTGGVAASGDVQAVKVVLGNGRTDYIVNALDNETLYTVDDKFLFKGFLGVYSEKDGRQVYGYVSDGTVIGDYTSTSPASAAGTVKSFTKDLNASNQLTVEFENEVDVNSLTGRFIYVDNDGVQNAAYKLNGIKSLNGNTVTFDLGATTLIRSYQDSSDIGKGYVYNIAENDHFVIPLSFEAKKNNAELEYIKLDNDLLTGFEPFTLNYRVVLPYGANKIPFVTAEAANENAVVEITQSGGIPGKAVIKVTDEDGVTTQTYEIEFVRESLFTAGDLRFTDSNGNTMTGLVSGANIKASVEITNNSGKPMIGMMLLVLYNKNDRVVNGTVAPLWVSANSTATVDAGLRLPARIDGHKIKAFIWDSRGGTTLCRIRRDFPRMTSTAAKH